MKLYLERKKDKQITFRLTREQYQQLQSLAQKENVTVPEICRGLIKAALEKTKP